MAIVSIGVTPKNKTDIILFEIELNESPLADLRYSYSVYELVSTRTGKYRNYIRYGTTDTNASLAQAIWEALITIHEIIDITY